jgi:hypothetical protein
MHVQARYARRDVSALSAPALVRFKPVAVRALALADLTDYQATHGPGGGALTSLQLLQIADLTGDILLAAKAP